jgi:hypothetical protein
METPGIYSKNKGDIQEIINILDSVIGVDKFILGEDPYLISQYTKYFVKGILERRQVRYE